MRDVLFISRFINDEAVTQRNNDLPKFVHLIMADLGQTQEVFALLNVGHD